MKIKKKTNRVIDVFCLTNPKTASEKISQYDLLNIDWITFFKDSNNLFPNNLAERARRSSTHHSILTSKYTYTVGEGFLFVNSKNETYNIGSNKRFDEYINKINSLGENLFDVFKKVAKDYIYFGNASIQIIKNENRINLEHFDTTNIRLGKKNKENKIEWVYYAVNGDWRDVTLSRFTDKQTQVLRIPYFNIYNKNKISILSIKEYEPEFSYYGLPDYIGALFSIDLEYRIPKFNIDRFDNGFFPSAMIQLFGNPPDGLSPQQYVQKFKEKFTGEGNNSKIIVEMLDDISQKANVITFDTIKEGDFTELKRLVTEDIISAHRWFPSLAGLNISGQLGNVQQILNEFEIAMNTIIPNYRNVIIVEFNKLLELAGFDIKISGIKNKMPISFLSSINPNKFIEINEAREKFGLAPKNIYENNLIESGEESQKNLIK